MKSLPLLSALAVAAAVACAAGPSPAPPPAPPSAPSVTAPPPAATASPDPIRDALAASDRSAADRELDAGRKSGELLAFFGIAPGMKVAELGAGGGYTAELLARIVGPTGRVYGQNSKLILERFAEKPWSERLTRPVMQNVVRVDREFDDPLPPEARDLDAVLMVLFYHDTVWFQIDRDKMNRAIFAALRSGGVYGIVDHHARSGAGLTEVETLHRIEERMVVDEIKRAGFRLDASSDLLANPDDPRDWNASPRQAAKRRGTSDRFVLRFVKP